MYFKPSGESKTNVGFKKVATYVSTADDKDKAHSNPKKTSYLQAKASYEEHRKNRTLIGKALAGEDLRQMYLYKPYTKRAIATATNMRGHTKADFVKDEQELMRNRKGVKSHEFVISPAPSDGIGPNNPASVERLADYAVFLAHVTFNGKFVKTNPYKYRYHDKKTGKTHVWTRYHNKYVYRPKHDTVDRFPYFLSIQPDSHNASRTHAHLVVLNRDMKTGKGMTGGYYGVAHCYKAVKVASKIWNERHPEHQMSGEVKPGRQATPHQGRIIEALEAVKRDKKITSRKKLIKALNEHGVEAKFLKKSKRRKHSGWKFRYKTGWVKASALSKVISGRSFSTHGIAEVLSVHRKQMAKVRRRIRAKARKTKLQHVASSPELPTVKQVYFHGHPLIIDPIQKLADDGTLFKLQDAQEDKIEASHDRWVRSNPRRLARYYEHDDPANQVVLMMKHLSSNPVRKSVPKVSNCYQKQCFPTYSVQDAQTGRREFRLLDGKLGYTHSDKGWFSRVFGGFVKDWNAFRDKAGRKLVHSAISRHWKRLTTSVKGYIRKHVQPPILEQLYRIYNRNNSQAVSEIITAAMSYNDTPAMYHKVLGFNADEAPKCYKLLNNDKVRRKLKKFNSKYNMYTWLWKHELVDNTDVIYRKRKLKRQRRERKILKSYGNDEAIRLMYRYCKITNTANKFVEKYIHTANASQTYLKRKYPNVINHFNMDKFIESKPWQKQYYKMTKTIQQAAQRRRAREQAAYERARTARYNHMMRLRRINARRRNQQQGPTLG